MLVFRSADPAACASGHGRSGGTRATAACSTPSPRTTSPTTAARWRRLSRRLTHEGLFVQASPWGLGRTFGGEAESRWVAFHPEECQVLDDGRRVAAACLNSAPYRAFCKEWADWVLECGVDMVFWDEPAWVVPRHVGVDDPTRWTCRCDRCAERFGGPVPGEMTAEVQAFRQASVVDFLGELVAHVAAHGGSNAICLLPATEGVVGMADWDVVAALPGLSTLVTDPYWKHWNEPAGPFVRRFARLLRATADRHGVGAQLWVPSFGLNVRMCRSSRRRSRRPGMRASKTSGPGGMKHAGT